MVDSEDKKATVLVAEDEEIVRNIVVRVLERTGYEVIVACDGAEAVELFKAQQGRIDLLLFDMVMPRLGGAAAAEQIHAIAPDVPAIFSSGYNDEADSARSDVHVIAKPYMPQDLVDKIAEVLALGDA